MEQPWRIGEDDEVYRADPILPSFAPGDWVAVEEWLEVSLRRNYKEVVGDGPALVFDDELYIVQPVQPVLAVEPYGRRIAYGSWFLAYLRQRHPDEFNLPLFPEPGGLLCWGQDGGGGVYYWNTMSPDPNTWTVIVSGRSVGDGEARELHECGLRKYLRRLASGRIAAAALGSWPGPDPQLRRVPD